MIASPGRGQYIHIHYVHNVHNDHDGSGDSETPPDKDVHNSDDENPVVEPNVNKVNNVNTHHMAQRALEAMRESPRLADLVRLYFEDKTKPNEVVSAVATHCGEAERWKEWLEPVADALEVIAADTETI